MNVIVYVERIYIGHPAATRTRPSDCQEKDAVLLEQLDAQAGAFVDAFQSKDQKSPLLRGYR